MYRDSLNQVPLYKDLVDMLTNDGILELNKSIIAITYDWRKFGIESYTREILEKINVTINKLAKEYKKKINIICHGMGCILSNIFLSEMNIEDKNRYIYRLIALYPNFSGSLEGLECFI